MASGAAALVAGIIDRIEGRPYRTGRPPLPTGPGDQGRRSTSTDASPMNLTR